MVPLPFCSSFYLTDSSPLLPFNNQVKEVHLYTGILQILLVISVTSITQSKTPDHFISRCRESQKSDVPADRSGRERVGKRRSVHLQ